MGVGAGLYMYNVVVKKFTFAVSSPDEFLFHTKPRDWLGKRLRNYLFCDQWDVKS